MIIAVFIICGAGIGAFTAYKRNAIRADYIQLILTCSIVAFIISLIITVILVNMAA